MTALVTGAGARIGRALAIRLAEAGHDVAVHYHASRDGAEETARAVRDAGRRAETLRADLLDPAAATDLLPRAVRALGSPVDCLVNNASIFEHDDVATATPESWHRHMGSNLLAPLLLIQSMAAQGLAPREGPDGEPEATGLVVNMIDQRVRKLTPHFVTYTLAKSGLWTLTRTMAQALAPAIRVNAIAPGPTIRGHRQSEAHFAAQRAGTVLHRGADASDVAAALAYLLEARTVTGQMIAVDGGQHLGWRTPDIVGRG